MIYFALASFNDISFVKIGYSKRPIKRISSIQSSCPLKVSLLGTRPGNRKDERTLHTAFKDCHVHGEWYRPQKDLLNTIKATTTLITGDGKNKTPI